MKTFKDLIEETKDMQADVFYSAEQSDRYDVGYWNEDAQSLIKEDNLLSIRVFNNNKEVLLSRSDIGQEFDMRIIVDEENDKDNCFDEWQLLDVDRTWFDSHKNEGTYRTTGGGVYAFPLPAPKDNEHPAVLIRHYLTRKTGANESGLTYVSDYRCVRFSMVTTNKNENGKIEIKEVK